MVVKEKINKNKTYAEKIQELEECISVLEQSDCELELALEKYKQGAKIAKELEQEISQARKKIELLEQK